MRTAAVALCERRCAYRGVYLVDKHASQLSPKLYILHFVRRASLTAVWFVYFVGQAIQCLPGRISVQDPSDGSSGAHISPRL